MRRYAGYLIAVAVCLALAAFFTFALTGYGFLGLCFVALAALILVFMGLKALSRRREKAARRLRRALIVLLILFFAAAGATEAVVIAHAAPSAGGEDYAIVLGAGVNGTVPSLSLHRRLEAALKYAGENPNATLILSGGQGRGEEISEARCMFDWLTRNGVDADRLIMEDNSTSTRENLTFSREIIDSLGGTEKPVAIVTAGYHLARAELMAGDLGYETVTSYPAPAGYPVLELNYYLREIPAIWVYLLTR